MAAFKAPKAFEAKSDSLSEVVTTVNEEFRGLLQALYEFIQVQDSKIVAFQGFDPATTMKILMETCKASEKNVGLLGVLIQFYVYNSASINKKKIARLSKEGKQIIEEAVRVFKVNLSEPGAKTLGRESITLSRIISVTPSLVMPMRRSLDPQAGVYWTDGKKIVTDGLFCSSEGAYMIPRGNNALFNAWNMWAKLYHVKVNVHNKTAEFKESIGVSKYESTLVSTSNRQAEYAEFEKRVSIDVVKYLIQVGTATGPYNKF